jgi:hypothetical protein
MSIFNTSDEARQRIDQALIECTYLNGIGNEAEQETQRRKRESIITIIFDSVIRAQNTAELTVDLDFDTRQTKEEKLDDLFRKIAVIICDENIESTFLLSKHGSPRNALDSCAKYVISWRHETYNLKIYTRLRDHPVRPDRKLLCFFMHVIDTSRATDGDQNSEQDTDDESSVITPALNSGFTTMKNLLDRIDIHCNQYL